MRRLFFYLFLVAVIGTSLILALFVNQYWNVYPLGSTTTIEGIEASWPDNPLNGFEMLFNSDIGFFMNLSNWEWAFDSYNVMVFSLIIFIIFCLAALLTLLLILLVNLGNLNKSRSLYRNGLVFFVAAMILTGAYIWFAVDFTSYTGLGWSIRTLPIAFYVPPVAGLIMLVWGGIARAVERRR